MPIPSNLQPTSINGLPKQVTAEPNASDVLNRFKSTNAAALPEEIIDVEIPEVQLPDIELPELPESEVSLPDADVPDLSTRRKLVYSALDKFITGSLFKNVIKVDSEKRSVIDKIEKAQKLVRTQMKINPASVPPPLVFFAKISIGELIQFIDNKIDKLKVQTQRASMKALDTELKTAEDPFTRRQELLNKQKTVISNNVLGRPVSKNTNGQNSNTQDC